MLASTSWRVAAEAGTRTYIDNQSPLSTFNSEGKKSYINMAPTEIDMPTEADILIVGGGTAGLVLAARLSEDSDVQVVVLESGQDMRGDPRVNTPALWPALVASEADWSFATAPQVKPDHSMIEFFVLNRRILLGSPARKSDRSPSRPSPRRYKCS